MTRRKCLFHANLKHYRNESFVGRGLLPRFAQA
jgi:hypothetical protein